MPFRQLTRPATRVRRASIHRSSHRPDDWVWLFDLDNTLHDTSHKIFAHISVGMTEAVMESLNVDETTAHELRRKYWEQYGATMIGLAKHHDVDPHQFLYRSHSFDVRPLIKAEKGLAQRFRKLPGRKVLVTNAPLHYAKAVLMHLGILKDFESIWSVEHMRVHGHYRPKPSVSLMRHILACEGTRPGRTVLIEDTLSNLKAARAVGLRTVHIYHPGTPFAHRRKGRPHYVDLRINQIRDLLTGRRKLTRRSTLSEPSYLHRD